MLFLLLNKIISTDGPLNLGHEILGISNNSFTINTDKKKTNSTSEDDKMTMLDVLINNLLVAKKTTKNV